MFLTHGIKRTGVERLTFNNVLDILRGKRLAIVGSGPSCRDNAAGFIDSHDVVIRINNYKIFPETGCRTDIYYSFFGTSIRKTVNQLQHDGVRWCLCKCPDNQFIESEWHKKNNRIHGVDFRYIYRRRERFWFCPTYVPTIADFMKKFNALQQHIPSTGIACIMDIMSAECEIYLTGFDFFRSGIHNVDEKWIEKNTDDPICHAPVLEAAWMRAHMDRFTVDPTMRVLLDEK